MQTIEALINNWFVLSDAAWAFLGSLGILLFNLVAVPIIGRIYGIQMTKWQAAKMSTTFFLIRVLWIYLVIRVAK